jgi:hypothetical protein
MIRLCWVSTISTVALVIFLTSTAYGQEATLSAPQTEEIEVLPPAQSQGTKRRIGAPQVLEIPVVEPPPSPPLLSEQEGWRARQPLPQGVPADQAYIAARDQGYLGVLYGTAEEGLAGVKVLGIVEGSPAEQAGFEGPLRSPTWKDQALKVAIPLLVLSPAAPLAIPLAILHDAYHSRQDPGDLIVEVEGHPVRDAQEFSEAMRRFGPGDTVSFAVMRDNRMVHLSAQLEKEPS